MTIFIHSVTTIEACRIIERLQAEIWGADDIEVTPDHVLLTLAKEGSIVLLAMDRDENPIGFAFGFLGFAADNRLKFASHIVGVLPAYQNRGIGYQLKLAQREAALARNLDLITWTFDPLQGRNARLNLRKLGAVCDTYLRNLYGDMRDGLNQGLSSDRFQVDWWIATDHVADRIAGRFVEQSLPLSECPILNSATTLDNGLLAPAETFDYPEQPSCLVEIPADVNCLKSEAPDLALKWRWQTRKIFEMAFATGYTAIDLLRREGRNYYLLQKTRK
jgi:predicted GNAT superfamily acetyltransferase